LAASSVLSDCKPSFKKKFVMRMLPRDHFPKGANSHAAAWSRYFALEAKSNKNLNASALAPTSVQTGPIQNL